MLAMVRYKKVREGREVALGRMVDTALLSFKLDTVRVPVPVPVPVQELQL